MHGFRSTFRDWAARANFPSEVAQMTLVHAVGDKWIRRRRRLMSEVPTKALHFGATAATAAGR
jgi:hypothetical protein